MYAQLIRAESSNNNDHTYSFLFSSVQPSKILAGIGLGTCLYFGYSCMKYVVKKMMSYPSAPQLQSEQDQHSIHHHEFYIPKYFSAFRNNVQMNNNSHQKESLNSLSESKSLQDENSFKIQFMKENSFALLLTWKGNQMFTSHVPFLIESNSNHDIVLKFHLAKANPHCKALEEFSKSIYTEESNRWKCMVLFTGPHFYISPKWYGDVQVQKRQVPTWNFTSIHAICEECQIIHDSDGKKEIVTELTNVNEEWLLKYSKNPNESDLVRYDFSKVDEKFSQVLLQEIVGFTLTVKELKEKWKLSQNKSPPIIQSVVEGLQRSGSDLAIQTAELMRNYTTK
ncbi:hypothetical protein C9374_000497 [Naegleria lovaniensis]|uniref:Uncharacterized protein n=1 Tax=Naegleria lovaniensis TaxID=51637 RepID=A0AA88GZ68_NAELO|nr:uncharacterized protein C9374_000497 [Naegleria lovaniensis]KAG2388333.1 hypothetical protein C9374_000497 [Naegleria lovaniensis]